MDETNEYLNTSNIKNKHCGNIELARSKVRPCKRSSRSKKGALYYLWHVRSCALSNQSQCSASNCMGTYALWMGVLKQSMTRAWTSHRNQWNRCHQRKIETCLQPHTPFAAAETSPQSWTLCHHGRHACRAQISEDEKRCEKFKLM